MKAKLASGIGALFKKGNDAVNPLPDFIELFSGEEEISSNLFVNHA